jgi:hypothetical protein
MLTFFNELEKYFGSKNAANLVVLNTGIRLYPILIDGGCGLHGPVAIVVEEERMIRPIVEALRGFADNSVFPLDAKIKDFKNRLKENEYEMIALYCRGIGERSENNLCFIKNAMLTRKIDQMDFDGVILVFFIRGIPPEMIDFFAGKLVFEGSGRGDEFRLNEEQVRSFYEKMSSYIPEIQNVRQELVNTENDNLFLSAAIKLTQNLIKDADRGEENRYTTGLMYACESSIKSIWKIENNYEEWFEILRKMIIQKGTGFSSAVERKKLSGTERLPNDDVLIYDQNYYYITENFFENTCRDFSYYISTCEMKHAMAEAGILYREGASRNYYSVRMPISTAKGIQFLQRRMKILREWMDRPGELSWFEHLNMRGETPND